MVTKRRNEGTKKGTKCRKEKSKQTESYSAKTKSKKEKYGTKSRVVRWTSWAERGRFEGQGCRVAGLSL